MLTGINSVQTLTKQVICPKIPSVLWNYYKEHNKNYSQLHCNYWFKSHLRNYILDIAVKMYNIESRKNQGSYMQKVTYS